MNKEEILAVIKSLAMSQGFYGRILEHINEYPEYLEFLERQNLRSTLDLVLYLES